MDDELDPFDFSLATELGMSVRGMRASLSNQEYLQWRAYHVWRNAQLELASKKGNSG